MSRGQSPKTVSHPPKAGHHASPKERVTLQRSFSALSVKAELSGTRSPLGLLDSPNTHLQDAEDEEVSRHVTLKRFRSFGSASKLSTLTPTALRHTPSPQHQASRQRAGASPVMAHAHDAPPVPKAAWGLALGGSSWRPPPIHTSLSLQSFDEADDQISDLAATELADAPQPPALGLAHAVAPAPLAVHSSAWRPPPILRPPSLTFIDEEEASARAHLYGGSRSATTPRHPSAPSARRGVAGAPAAGFRARAASPVPPMSRVAPRLYVGDETAAASSTLLAEAGVTHVLNCTHREVPLEGAEHHAALARHAPGHYLCLGLLDNASDLPRVADALEQGVAFICQAVGSGGTVLVHCHKGISRSPTVAIAYLAQATRTPVDDVFTRMRDVRRVVDPNLCYMIALQEWEARLGLSHEPRPSRTPGAFAESPARVVRPLSRAG